MFTVMICPLSKGVPAVTEPCGTAEFGTMSPLAGLVRRRAR